VPVAERTYRAWKHAQPSDRDLADAVVIDTIRAVRINEKGEATPESMYGRRKMTALLRRQDLAVSKRQVDRLMRQLGINGLVRGKGVRTTTPDRNAARAPDLLDRDFTAPAPNRRWVADFTYVRTWAGFVYVSFAETLALEGIAASIGSIGDAYDNALAESTIGLFENEAIRDGSPFRTGPLRTIDDVEWVTTDWVDWYNARRLHSTIGDVPPDELEAAYYAGLETPAHPVLAPA